MYAGELGLLIYGAHYILKNFPESSGRQLKTEGVK